MSISATRSLAKLPRLPKKYHCCGGKYNIVGSWEFLEIPIWHSTTQFSSRKCKKRHSIYIPQHIHWEYTSGSLMIALWSTAVSSSPTSARNTLQAAALLLHLHIIICLTSSAKGYGYELEFYFLLSYDRNTVKVYNPGNYSSMRKARLVSITGYY